MLRRGKWAACTAAILVLSLVLPLRAQLEDTQQNVPAPVPPPLPPEEPPDDALPYQDVAPESDKPWGLPDEFLNKLRVRAGVYLDYARRFTCTETARLANYGPGGQVANEELRRYVYLLFSDRMGESFRESRQQLGKEGKPRGGEVEDAERFPPAYAWVFMFSRFHEPYFQFRQIGTHFDGFNLVNEVQFRGSLPFRDGRDIRQWEGTVLVDAFKHTPLEIRAEPRAQRERIEDLYRTWARSFNVIGFRTKPPPLGYRALVEFRYQREALSFPTELRYDTFRAVGPRQIVPVRASTRSYGEYRFYETSSAEELGDVKP